MKAKAKTLTRMARDKKLTNKEKGAIRRIMKALLNSQLNLRGKNKKIIRALRKKIKEIRKLAEQYQNTLDLIKRCEERKLDLGPSAYGASLDFVEFSFPHPDFNATYYIYGLAYTTNLTASSTKKKRDYGILCLSTDDPNYKMSRISGEFPSEKQVTFYDDACSPINSVTRNFIYCPTTYAGYPEGTGIRWIDWGVSTRPASDSKRRDFEKQIEKAGSTYGRSYIKKKRECSE